MMAVIEAFSFAVQRIEDVRPLSQKFVSTLRSLGIDQIQYTHVAQNFRRIPGEKAVRLSEVNSEWVRRYVEKGYSRDQPGIAEAQRRSAPYRLSEFASAPSLTARQEEFIQDVMEAGMNEVFVLPVFARPGDFAAFSFASSQNDLDLSDEEMSALRSLCQAFHVRYNSLTTIGPEPTLSPRELEVLEHIARGRSNQAIARSLGVTANTVDTLVRRCFGKLNATTRIEAVLAAIGMGLILP